MNEQLIYEEDLSIKIPLVENTDSADIAKTDPNLNGLAKPVTPKTIPEMIAYMQPVSAPQGYVFGLTSKDKTAITPADADDLVISRKLIQTTERSVNISTTNEVEEDIISLFGNSFASLYGEYNKTGEVASSKIASYFLDYGEWRLASKTNSDFMTWLDSEATAKGTVTIPDYISMEMILGTIGELKEALFKSTSKQGRVWAIVSPRIASYLSTVSGVWLNPELEGYNRPDSTIKSYVCTIGDMDVYQYSDISTVTGGQGPSTETTGKIRMGIYGGPGQSSVIYNPYKKYILKTGSNPQTGQSSVIYKIRDSWSTNPQDTYDGTQTGTDNSTLVGTNKSQFTVKCDVVFSFSLLS